ncbi:MAG TPA: AraC family transcriptional regulator [Gemmatimonadales bacterium]|nr:AraC family transcriptional regulator [Gemmatimonadales bacterium]
MARAVGPRRRGLHRPGHALQLCPPQSRQLRSRHRRPGRDAVLAFGSVHTASPGTVIALNPAEVHDGRAGSPEGCRYRMLYIERGAIDHLFAAEALPTGRSLALRGPVLHDVQLAQAVRRLHETLDRVDADAGLQLEQQARFVEVLFGVLARYGAPAPAGLRMGAEACCVARAREYLDEHLGEPVTLLDLAAAVGLSPFYFLRTFKRATGLPPHAYQNQLRLARARRLLSLGEPPARVAAGLGFVDQSHLTRRFKAAFGVTPGQYAYVERPGCTGAAPAHCA